MPNGEGVDVIEEQDRFLPIANIARIMKRVVPEEGKLSKESKECVQECVTEFIQFVVSEASDVCVAEKRKTITCEDLLRALSTLGFDSYVDVLKTYIENYRAASKHSSTNAVQIDAAKITPQQRNIKQEEQNEVTALEQVQVYLDNTSGQHYMIVKGANGEDRLVPVSIQADGLPLANGH